ncbi:hypothetical protein [Methanimicrococcus hongohii]|uniref:hypothetical protein n=1 Tax=Methanimicrococcus hongohii TaxID=3028295 RepID=UPI00292FFE25|nr:hypothetical protein [Methanimicrococcus sp. Hf6]
MSSKYLQLNRAGFTAADFSKNVNFKFIGLRSNGNRIEMNKNRKRLRRKIGKMKNEKLTRDFENKK